MLEFLFARKRRERCDTLLLFEINKVLEIKNLGILGNLKNERNLGKWFKCASLDVSIWTISSIADFGRLGILKKGTTTHNTA